jgi:hypothetical protein
VSDVRAFAASLQIVLLFFLLLLSPRAPAQEQERKLVDRLLRPDMTLQNSAQNKRFVAPSVSVDRKVKTWRFFWENRNNTKEFSGIRKLPSPQFHFRSFQNTKEGVANLSAKRVADSDIAFETQAATGLRRASDADKKVNGREFAGTRPFLERGKSQKELSRRDRPLTIEEVRELLNKNK